MNLNKHLNLSKSDAPEFWQFGLQDSATPSVEGMGHFHDYLMVCIITIGVFVFWMLYIVVTNFDAHKKNLVDVFTHSSTLEIVWTIIPAFVLVLLAVPSFALLYSLDETIDPSVTLKVVGHQWYWSYEYSDYVFLENGDSLNFDSYMIASDDLIKGSFRLLEVDNRIVLPINSHIRLLVTAADVLHSWAIPSFGIKVDACPGRLSQASLFIKREGVYYGQCSEICGVNHGFMPIVIKSVSSDVFINWIAQKLELS
jgi:cytochrome c oxidase subunit 2